MSVRASNGSLTETVSSGNRGIKSFWVQNAIIFALRFANHHRLPYLMFLSRMNAGSKI